MYKRQGRRFRLRAFGRRTARRCLFPQGVFVGRDLPRQLGYKGSLPPDRSLAAIRTSERPNDGRPAYAPLRICAASAYDFLYVQYGHVRAGADKGKRLPELRG